MNDLVSTASRRVMRTTAADGLGEIAAGACFLPPALMGFAKDGLDTHSASWRIFNVIQMLVICPAMFLVQWGLPKLRNRWFGSRVGTMIPKAAPEGWSRAAAAAIVAFMTAGVAAIVLAPGGSLRARLGALLLGASTAAILGVTGWQSGVQRYYWMAAAIAAASVAIVAATPDLETAFLRQFLFIGALSLAVGIATLWRYLRSGSTTRADPMS